MGLQLALGLETFLILIFLFVMASFLGTVLISKVPSQLHTPLMSATNAISAITIVGGIIGVAVGVQESAGVFSFEFIICFIAVILAALNCVGGYAVTGRMLEMFKPKEEKK